MAVDEVATMKNQILANCPLRKPLIHLRPPRLSLRYYPLRTLAAHAISLFSTMHVANIPDFL